MKVNMNFEEFCLQINKKAKIHNADKKALTYFLLGLKLCLVTARVTCLFLTRQLNSNLSIQVFCCMFIII